MKLLKLASTLAFICLMAAQTSVMGADAGGDKDPGEGAGGPSKNLTTRIETATSRALIATGRTPSMPSLNPEFLDSLRRFITGSPQRPLGGEMTQLRPVPVLPIMSIEFVDLRTGSRMEATLAGPGVLLLMDQLMNRQQAPLSLLRNLLMRSEEDIPFGACGQPDCLNCGDQGE